MNRNQLESLLSEFRSELERKQAEQREEIRLAEERRSEEAAIRTARFWNEIKRDQRPAPVLAFRKGAK